MNKIYINVLTNHLQCKQTFKPLKNSNYENLYIHCHININDIALICLLDLNYFTYLVYEHESNQSVAPMLIGLIYKLE